MENILHPEEEPKRTPVQKFYKGQNVFITGGTGFLGKILIEKLLRSCDVENIYMLVRSKKGKDIYSRLDYIFDDTIFDLMKKEVPKFRHKIHGIPGDCALPAMGLKSSDQEMLKSEVNIVFHVAATVRFDEHIKLATAINVQSTKDVLELCKEMKNLKSVIYVSTAYANCHMPEIKEEFYDPPMDATKMLSFVGAASEKLIDDITPILLDKWPNTYAYTKAIAEDMVRQIGAGLPIAVFRPAIVISTYREPVVGWIDNLYGPTGVAAGVGSGLIRTLQVNVDAVGNMVPVDMCVNAIIASAWDAAERSQKQKVYIDDSEKIVVYNYVSDPENSVTWLDYMNKIIKYGINYPTQKAIWYLSFRMYQNRFANLIAIYLLHLLPAMLIDSVCVCVGKKPKLIDAYKKVHKFSAVIEYFSTRNWTFRNDNVRELWNKLGKEDQDIFFFDMRQLDWDDYFREYYKGLRRYLLKDPDSTLTESRIKWNRLYWAHQMLKGFLIFIFLRLLWLIFSKMFI